MVKDWISAARPRTLPASASPVIAASAYAFYVSKPLRLVLYNKQGILTKRRDYGCGGGRAYSFYGAEGQIFINRLLVLRQLSLHQLRLELLSVILMTCPVTSQN